MISKENCFLLGNLIKTHGIKGELIIKHNRTDIKLKKMEPVLIPMAS